MHNATYRGLVAQKIILILVSMLFLGVCCRSVYAQGGAIAVQMLPAAAVSAGAEYCIDGGTWSTGTSPIQTTAASHTVSFKPITGWTTPASKTVTVTDGTPGNQPTPVSVTGTYVAITSTGSIQVTINPAAAVSAGAMWQVDSGSWQSSGAMVNGLSNGNHTVAFSSISGYTPPLSQSLAVVAGQTTSFTGTYQAVATTGNLQVTLSPAAAVSAGAQWKADSGSWQSSGATVTGLSVGSHTVSFNTVSGYITPGSQILTVNTNQTATATGTYQLTTLPNLHPYTPSGWAGPVIVTTDPGGVTPHSPVFSTTDTLYCNRSFANDGPSSVTTPFHIVTDVDGVQKDDFLFNSSTASPFGSGYVTWTPLSIGTLAAGTHTFRMVVDSQNQVAESDESDNEYSMTITVESGTNGSENSLQVTLSPSSVVSAGAKWQVNGNGVWQNSGATVSGLAPGLCAVSFSCVPGWTAPDTRWVDVVANSTTPVSETYISQQSPAPAYFLTRKTYSSSANMRAAALAEFGPGATIADWKAIKALLQGNPDSYVETFCTIAGLASSRKSAWVTHNGQGMNGGIRHYFIERDDGAVPGGFVVHDLIGSHILDLGSALRVNKPILVRVASTTPVIVTMISPTNGGKVSGAGLHARGKAATLTASAYPHYRFVNWSEHGKVVGTSARYTFIASKPRVLVANFVGKP